MSQCLVQVLLLQHGLLNYTAADRLIQEMLSHVVSPPTHCRLQAEFQMSLVSNPKPRGPASLLKLVNSLDIPSQYHAEGLRVLRAMNWLFRLDSCNG